MLAVGGASACAALGYDGDDRSGLVTEASYLGPLSLVGALKGNSSEHNESVFGDVAAYKNLAFLGTGRRECPGTGVDIIDISQPSAPTKLSDTNDYPDTSMEDMQAIEIGGRDILVIGLQDCQNDPAPGVGKSGLELYDITDPSNPHFLSLFDTNTLGPDSGGVHELDVTETPSGEVLALGAVPSLEANSSDSDGKNGTGDLLIWKITDPANPTLLGEWGVLDEPSLGLEAYHDTRQGGDLRTFGHSPRANADGTRVYLSYWDVGVIILDISDPSKPVYLGRTTYAEGEEGNAHSTDEARGGNILVQADEDTSPFQFELTSNAFSGKHLAAEATFDPPIAGLAGQQMDGEVVHVGRGCPAGSITATNPEDPYLANPSGKIALIERGECRFDDKIARAQQAGAKGVIVYDGTDGGDEDRVNIINISGSNPVTLPDGTVVDINTLAVFVQRSTGLLLRDSTPPVTTSASRVFNGWGYLRFFDIKDPANPKQLSTFATENTNNEALANETLATQGEEWWSVHNPEVRGNIVYASWFSDGVRVIDISDPSSPREIGSWTGEDAPEDAPAVYIWGVVPHGDLLLVSDRNYGLYILEHTP
ncbi:MAG: hypothetical protein M3305_18350 [Actinomycetota bacterium]|nr:hypothetical protein [Actinomycetota bacterium]